MRDEPRLAGRVRGIGQEEHPAVHGQERAEEPHHERAGLGEAEDRVGDGHVRRRPEAHVDEEVAVGAGRGVLAIDGEPGGEHERGDHVEGAEGVEEHRPCEGLGRHARGEADPRALRLVGDGSRRRPYAREQREGGAAVHRHDAIVVAKPGGARGRARQEDPVVDVGVKARIRSADIADEPRGDADEHQHRRDHESGEAPIRAQHRGPDDTREGRGRDAVLRSRDAGRSAPCAMIPLTACSRGRLMSARWTRHRTRWRRHWLRGERADAARSRTR